jgi:hypothetical protein
MNGLIRIVLTLAQVPEKDISDLDKSLPGLARLCDLAKQLEPIIQRNLPHIKAIEPDIPAITSIIKAAWPDIVAVTPTIDEYVNLAKGN